MEKKFGMDIRLTRKGGKTRLHLKYSPEVAELVKAEFSGRQSAEFSKYKLEKGGEMVDADMHIDVSSQGDRMEKYKTGYIATGGSVRSAFYGEAANMNLLFLKVAVDNPGTEYTVWSQPLDGMSLETAEAWVKAEKEAMWNFIRLGCQEWEVKASLQMYVEEPVI